MKKYEKLKYAYDNYPKGTKFLNLGCDFIRETISSGIFHLDEYGVRDPTTYSYVLGTEGVWANIIPESILSGRCAIQVNNEREFKLLMEHYDSKGFVSGSGNNSINPKSYPVIVPYEQSFWIKTPIMICNYRLTSFLDFAKEIGIEAPPVFVMTSEDGVDLYEGDDYFRAGRDKANASGDFVLFETKKIKSCHFVCMYPDTDKAFSTKHSALDWIQKQNKPKEVHVKLFNENNYAIVA